MPIKDTISFIEEQLQLKKCPVNPTKGDDNCTLCAIEIYNRLTKHDRKFQPVTKKCRNPLLSMPLVKSDGGSIFAVQTDDPRITSGCIIPPRDLEYREITDVDAGKKHIVILDDTNGLQQFQMMHRHITMLPTNIDELTIRLQAMPRDKKGTATGFLWITFNTPKYPGCSHILNFYVHSNNDVIIIDGQLTFKQAMDLDSYKRKLDSSGGIIEGKVYYIQANMMAVHAIEKPPAIPELPKVKIEPQAPEELTSSLRTVPEQAVPSDTLVSPVLYAAPRVRDRRSWEEIGVSDLLREISVDKDTPENVAIIVKLDECYRELFDKACAIIKRHEMLAEYGGFIVDNPLYAIGIAEGLQYLLWAGILAENRELILADIKRVGNVGWQFFQLNKAGLLSQFRDLILANYDKVGWGGKALANDLVKLHEAGILEENSAILLANPLYAHSLAIGFVLLHEASILSENRSFLLADPKNAGQLGQSFARLQEHSILMEYREFIIAHSENAWRLTLSLDCLQRRGILAENRAFIMEHYTFNEKLTGAFCSLHDAGILEENRAALLANPEQALETAKQILSSLSQPQKKMHQCAR